MTAAFPGRGSPVLRGIVCGLMTTIGGLGHTAAILLKDSQWAIAHLRRLSCSPNSGHRMDPRACLHGHAVPAGGVPGGDRRRPGISGGNIDRKRLARNLQRVRLRHCGPFSPRGMVQCHAFALAICRTRICALPQPRWSDLVGKRITGYINWRRKRSAIHQRPILDALIADLKTQTFDHLAVTGDLTNLAAAGRIPGGKSVDEIARTARERHAHSRQSRCLCHLAARRSRQQLHPLHAGRQRKGRQLSIRAAARCARFDRAIERGADRRPSWRPVRWARRNAPRSRIFCRKLKREGLFRVVLVHHPLHSDPKDWYKRADWMQSACATCCAFTAPN